MKIVVINYDELNSCPSKVQIIDDVRRLFLDSPKELKEEMGSVLVSQLTSVIDLPKNTDHNNICDISFFETSDRAKRNQLRNYINKIKPDLIVSYNLAGFELSTLADSLLYNLLDCRQFHIIQKKHLPNEKYLSVLRSMNLFIFEDYKDGK